MHRPSFGVKKWYRSKLDNSSRENIFNFKIPVEFKGKITHSYLAHTKFKDFVGKVIDEVSIDLDNDVGEIITAHQYQTNLSEDNEYLEFLKNLYNSVYLEDLPETNLINKSGNRYPRFSEDLLSKNDMQYKKFEEKSGINL